MLRGPQVVGLRDQAQLALPEGYGFVPAKEGAAVMDLLGNQTDERFLGLIFPQGEDTGWFVTMDYEPAGYIKDDDARDWNADELLESLKQGTEADMYLHHVEDPARAIREMARIVRPGGRVVITDLDEHSFEFLRSEQHDRRLGFKREDVRRWFEESGLTDVHVDQTQQSCHSDSQTGDVKASVRSFLPWARNPS